MPPGFSSELTRHLTQDPPIDDRTGIPLLDLENYCCGMYSPWRRLGEYKENHDCIILLRCPRVLCSHREVVRDLIRDSILIIMHHLNSGNTSR